uniref:Uncharacterized protein n=1 Tax=Glossina palpalis gambiensis TaxID=67801 RepID=A0A1B0B287_9MUSC
MTTTAAMLQRRQSYNNANEEDTDDKPAVTITKLQRRQSCNNDNEDDNDINEQDTNTKKKKVKATTTTMTTRTRLLDKTEFFSIIFWLLFLNLFFVTTSPALSFRETLDDVWLYLRRISLIRWRV